MIGEHEIAAGFSSFWSELLPLLTPACVTVFNKSYGDYLEGYRPVDKELGIRTEDISAPDLLAEAAFEVFRISHSEDKRTRDVIESEHALSVAWRVAENSISMHRPVRAQQHPAPGSIDMQYLLALGRRYDALKEVIPFDNAIFSPKIRGCGVLGLREADIGVERSLIEIKTVDRNFNSKDIKQVLIYLALDFVSGERRWDSVYLFNPRRSFLASFKPSEFIGYISAGKAAPQIYREIESFLLHRDFRQEHQF